MPHNRMHDFLDASFRRLGGDKNAFSNMHKDHKEEDEDIARLKRNRKNYRFDDPLPELDLSSGPNYQPGGRYYPRDRAGSIGLAPDANLNQNQGLNLVGQGQGYPIRTPAGPGHTPYHHTQNRASVQGNLPLNNPPQRPPLPRNSYHPSYYNPNLNPSPPPSPIPQIRIQAPTIAPSPRGMGNLGGHNAIPDRYSQSPSPAGGGPLQVGARGIIPGVADNMQRRASMLNIPGGNLQVPGSRISISSGLGDQRVIGDMQRTYVEGQVMRTGYRDAGGVGWMGGR